jgi:hypothetical protein
MLLPSNSTGNSSDRLHDAWVGVLEIGQLSLDRGRIQMPVRSQRGEAAQTMSKNIRKW